MTRTLRPHPARGPEGRQKYAGTDARGTPVTLLATVIVLAGCAGTARTGLDDAPRTYSFWPQFPAEPHVQFLTAYRFSSDIEPAKGGLEQLVFGDDAQVLRIRKPYGVEMRDGKIYVCDTRNGSVTVLDLRKRQTRVLRTRGLGGLIQPTDAAIADDGMIYISDLQRGVIFVFDPQERHVTTLGHEGLKPAGIAVRGDELYVADFGTLSVLVLDRQTGVQLRAIGEMGGEDGQFVRPLGVDVDAEGNVWVVDVIKCRLQKFDPMGELLQATGRISDTAGSFVRPKHIAVDSEGIVYVVDAAFDNVQMFNEEGRVLMFFGSGGGHPGSMDLPAGVCVNEGDLDLFEQYVHPAFEPRRLIVVTNQFGRHKVAVYAMGELREGATVQDISATVSPIRSGVRAEGETNPLTEDMTRPAPPEPDAPRQEP
ncbi:MAG: SMP-30/gluconolactonase/LRE family protein [Planctomycetota bacterium]|jgi:streptogramin lyase